MTKKKGKGGRPKLCDKWNMVSFVTTPEQKKRIELCAKMRKVSQADLIRSAIDAFILKDESCVVFNKPPAAGKSEDISQLAAFVSE